MISVEFLAAGTYKVTATVSLGDGTELTCLFVRLEKNIGKLEKLVLYFARYLECRECPRG